MRYLRIHTLGFAVLLVVLTVIHCAPTEAQADRRRRPWTTYGSDRGRLVVACDMRSDTCSDGRKITTTRATPVPCEVAPGQWVMVGPDEGCYSVRGLETWAQNTSYLSWGAELGRSPWSSGGAAGHVVRVYDVEGINRMCQEAPLSPTSPAGRYQFTPIPTEAGTNTLSCIARPNTGSNIRLNAGDSSRAAIFPMEPGWARYTHSTVVEEGQGTAMSVYTLGQTCIDIVGCWYTKASTPGRPCWGGEAPVTCAADRHTISTEGWPTEAGEISLVFTVGESTTHQYLIDGRAPGDVSNKTLLLVERLQRRLRLDIVPGSATHGPVLEAGRTYAARLRVAGGRTAVFLDGVKVIDVRGTPNWAAVATLGNRFEQDEPLNGAISSIRVRRFE